MATDCAAVATVGDFSPRLDVDVAGIARWWAIATTGWGGGAHVATATLQPEHHRRWSAPVEPVALDGWHSAAMFASMPEVDPVVGTLVVMGGLTGFGRGDSVRRYYDANTWKFLLTGSQRAIHRELWGPGVANRAEAVHHAHSLVLDELGPDDRRVLDLGCGVGTAALYLADRLPVQVVGVSISPAQIRLAGRYAAQGGPRPGRVRFMVADFTALPHDLVGFDLAFAIESFVHADPTAAFFHEVARLLRPGGALVVIDDVRTGDQADPRLADFRAGWHAPSVVSVDEAAGLAADAGLDLVGSRDLSPLQRLRRPRDRAVHAAQPLLRLGRGRSMWADSMVGGDALQQCHLAGVLEYRLLRFVRRPG